MSDGPAPGMVTDWFTWGGVLFFAALVSLVWVIPYILAYERQPPPVAVPVPASPCVNSGHAYRAQPTVWRCCNCGDERTSEDVYDQEHAA